jgi:hypothetical protein
MCLHLRTNHDIPYTNTKTRWKVVNVRTNKLGRKCYSGPYTEKRYSKAGVWMKATRDPSYSGTNPADIGFHVFVLKRAALDRARMFFTDGKVSGRVIKVEVDGFNASGTFGGAKTETWKKMRLI